MSAKSVALVGMAELCDAGAKVGHSAQGTSPAWSVFGTIIRVLDSTDLYVLAHYLVFCSVIAATGSLVRREFKKASESYARAHERFKSEDDKHSWETGTIGEDGNRMQLIEEGDDVVHADLGRGKVISMTKTTCLVEFEAMNDSKTVELKNLLYIGMRVRHGLRGWGTVEMFDENDRVHVSFDSGEYHRYKFESWKKKMIPTNRFSPEKQTFRAFLYQYLLYRSDYVLTTFTFAKPLVLLLSTYTLIVVGASAYSRVSGKSTAESLWVAWTMVADPGTHADEEGALQRIVALFLTLGGMLVFALMIGIIADGVSSLLDELKQGNSAVIESGHTLVLGWSDKTLPFLREICLANESLGGGAVVIMADRPKQEMEREVAEVIPQSEARGTLIICRTGIPTNQSDLRRVSAGSARSVVVLADNKLEPDESDARAVRAVLSLFGIRRPRMGHVVVEMCDVDNRDLALLADSKNVEVVVAHDLIGRLMIQCAREPGLAQILDELLGFEGDEFYIKAWPGVFQPGTTFGEILFRFEDAVPLGIKPHDRKDAYEQIQNSEWRRRSLHRRGWDGASPNNHGDGPNREFMDFALRQGPSEIPVIDHFGGPIVHNQPVLDTLRSEGREADDAFYDEDDPFDEGERLSRAVILNPPNDYILREKDEILVLAEDDDSYEPRSWEKLPKSARQAFDSMEPAHRPSVQTRPERFLFCGWRRDMDDMIMELDQLVGPGSEVTIMCMVPQEERRGRFEQGGLDVSRLNNLTIRHVMGNPILRRDLRRLPNRLDSFASILILADQALETNVSSADSRSLASLLLIRDMIAKQLKRKERRPGALNGSGRPAPLEKGLSFSDNEQSMSVASPSVGSDSPVVHPQRRNLGGPPSPGTSSRPLFDKQLSYCDDDGISSPRGITDSPLEGSRRLLKRENSDSKASIRSGRLGLMGDSFMRKQADNFVRRPSSVGQALFFENAHNTGSTVLISEILDSRTKALVPVAQIGDHVMSNEIVAATLAMVSECRDISVILNELLQADGNDLHIRSALDYGSPGEKIDFWVLQARARARGEIAIGYRSAGDKRPTLNPREKCAKFTLSAKGTVIVIAED